MSALFLLPGKIFTCRFMGTSLSQDLMHASGGQSRFDKIRSGYRQHVYVSVFSTRIPAEFLPYLPGAQQNPMLLSSFRKRFAWKRVKFENDPHCEAEVQVLKQLKHHGVVGIYQVFSQGGALDLILELCSRGDMQQFIESKVEPAPMTGKKMHTNLASTFCAFGGS